MIKRILLTSLLLFMPFFVHADDVTVIGGDIYEKNIPFDSNLMQKVFNKVFGYSSDYENMKKVFYTAVNDSLSAPFSMEDLSKICWESVPEFGADIDASQCFTLLEIYLDEIVKVSEKNATKTQNPKTCAEKDPNDMNFTHCCIAQDEGVAKWDPYKHVCSCIDVSKKWNSINRTCDYKENSSCEERYPGNKEAIQCCYGESNGESKWNDITGECKCFGGNKMWNSNKYECVEIKF